jgi:hypothetical protein
MPSLKVQSIGIVVLLGLVPAARTEQPSAREIEFFEKKIRPVLVEHCYACHSAESAKAKKLRGGLLLDSRTGIRKGGDNGAVLVAGKPAESLLIQAMKYDGLKMPPKGKLPEAVVADFARWIEMGAPDPRDGSPLTAKRDIDIEAGRKYWAFRPLTPITPPRVKNEKWGRTPVDRFILAKLEEKGLHPSPALSREKLLRRAYFDLLGLPPTLQEIDAFVKDTAPDAFEKVIDRLLQSDRHGERWARHWLDTVRFAESGGYEFDKDRPGAYHYRDFVIKALNQDMPYDEFVRLQIAGDQLKPGDIPATAATGFLVAGPFPGQTTAKTLEPIRYDQLDDMVATLGTSMLGLSLGCARCHEHKYDPIPQQDYYHLIACLARTDSTEVKFLLDAEVYGKAKAAFDKVHTPLVTARDRFEKEELPGRLQKWREVEKDLVPSRTAAELLTLLDKTKGKPAGKDLANVIRLFRPFDPEAERVYKAVEDSLKGEPKPKQLPVFAAASGKGGDVHYLIRGETGRKNGIARPGFVQVLMDPSVKREHWLGAPAVKGKSAEVEPRVGLARWLTDTKSGAGHLLARVIVNRLWQHHIGRGLVRTPNDFGIQGEPPTHPELLDWLAGELIHNGWKLKPIHKLIMTSAVYAQDGKTDLAAMRADPQNLLWGRVPPRRLEAEAIRDNLLAISGTLDLTMYGPGTLNENDPRRSVYLTVKRSRLIPLMQMFDSPEPIQSIGERQSTTAATQALAMMNSIFVRQRAEKFALRIRSKSADALPQAVDEAYRTVLGRRPTPTERDRILGFIERQTKASSADAALADFCQVLLCSNEFIYVD